MTAQQLFSFKIIFSKFGVLARLSCIKVNPGLTQNFSKFKKGIGRNLEKLILTCFTKMIAEQSSVIQYA